MGMFDTIYWRRHHLIDEEPPMNSVWQSKSIRALMDTFEVREDGRLWVTYNRDDWILEEDKTETDDTIYWENYDFTGVVNMYGCEDCDNDRYTVVFSHGLLLHVCKETSEGFYEYTSLCSDMVNLLWRIVREDDKVYRDMLGHKLAELIKAVV